MEVIQGFFFRKLLLLPKNTPAKNEALIATGPSCDHVFRGQLCTFPVGAKLQLSRLKSLKTRTILTSLLEERSGSVPI